jgi:arylsulfatase A-like enzyme
MFSFSAFHRDRRASFTRALVAVIASTLTVPAALSQQPALRPNIVVIFTDDQGYGDLGCYGSPNIVTPNIDRMASEGMRFTSFYAAPFCGPSRAQLMTGCYHARVSHSHNEGPGALTGLHPNEITVAEIVKSAGYATMHIGKWHLGDAAEFLPTRQGFDSFFGLPFSNDMWPYHPKMPPRPNEDELMTKMRARAAYTGFAGQGSYYAEGRGFPKPLPLMRNEEVIEQNPNQTQLTTRYTKKALEFIETHRKGPFFLYLAHAMPHVPLFVSDKFDGTSNRGLYGDVIMEIDWSCGQIMAKLKELGIDQDTLVIYTSDNGPWLGYGIDGGSAGPFREGKGTTWEGGMRVPGIFRWPGKIAPGQRSEAIVGNIDLLPTIAQLAGVPVPDDRVIDGRSLWPLLSGETDNGPHELFHFFGGGRAGNPMNYRAVRDERWKLILRSTAGGEVSAIELYDLGADPSEKFDRLKHHPEIGERLLIQARKFRRDLAANRRPVGRVSQR